jgi:hypothetical protein
MDPVARDVDPARNVDPALNADSTAADQVTIRGGEEGLEEFKKDYFLGYNKEKLPRWASTLLWTVLGLVVAGAVIGLVVWAVYESNTCGVRFDLVVEIINENGVIPVDFSVIVNNGDVRRAQISDTEEGYMVSVEGLRCVPYKIEFIIHSANPNGLKVESIAVIDQEGREFIVDTAIEVFDGNHDPVEDALMTGTGSFFVYYRTMDRAFN